MSDTLPAMPIYDAYTSQGAICAVVSLHICSVDNLFPTGDEQRGYFKYLFKRKYVYNLKL